MNDYYLFLGKEEGLKNEAVNTVINFVERSCKYYNKKDSKD